MLVARRYLGRTVSEEDEPDWADRSLFYASTLHLEFPVHDIEEMTKRLTAHNAGASAFGGEPTWPTTSLPT